MTNNKKGFTLVELLVVIAIIAVLAAVVVLVVNPLELTKRSRDAVRLADLATLQQAINVVTQSSTAALDTVLCAGGFDATQTYCTGVSSTAGARATDGTGWVKVNLGAQTAVSVPVLPLDPSNSGSNVYNYKADAAGFEITASLESAQYAPKMGQDGGTGANNALYEVGTKLSL